MTSKSQHLQIRVTPRQKAALKRLASAAGQDLSSYVLAQVLPSSRIRFEELIGFLGKGTDHRYVLAELNDLLSTLAPGEFHASVAHADVARLSPFLRNYVAAMVEQAAYQKGVSPPRWTAAVEPLDTPYFAAQLESLRLHLLRASPVPFRRRNLFVDAAIGERV